MQIDFYFDFISPYSYLAATQLAAFEKEYRAQFNWIPVSLPKLMKLSGNTPPGSIRNKAIYSLHDLKRWAKHLDVPFKMVRPGTFDSGPALSIAAAMEDGERIRFSRALFDAIWSGIMDMRDPAWLESYFEREGLPMVTLEQGLSHDPIIVQQTVQACEAGCFGVPTFMLHSRGRPEMFVGVDHLQILAHSCKALA